MKQQRWKWLPPWNMPSEPVKAIYWFLHWLLQVLVRYFALLILAGVAYETYLNGIVGLIGTLFIGLVVWGVLAALLAIVSFMTKISETLAQVQRLSQNPFENLQSSGTFRTFDPFSGREQTPPEENNVVEGTIITDLGEERRKRRQEM